MRHVTALLLLLSVVLIGGCMQQSHRTVREVMLIKSGITAEGTRTIGIIFQRDKPAERDTRIKKQEGSPEAVTVEKGQMSADGFERLVKTVEENDFYSKKAYKGDPDSVGGLIIGIIVLADEGETNIDVDPRDPQIQNIITAIEKEASEINWKRE